MNAINAVAGDSGAYLDSAQISSSQKEIPELWVKGDRVQVGGSQDFIIRGGVVERASLPAEYRRLDYLLRDCAGLLGGEGSFLDIGCSAGLLCFLAREAGFRSVTGLDHDRDHIGILAAASQVSGLSVQALLGNWRDAPGAYDVVAGMAAIHWIFPAAVLEGSFDAIFRHLASRTRRYLLLEWVAPEDATDTRFGHISRNAGVQREPYRLENFLAAAQTHFAAVDAVIETSRTRHVYVFRKQAPLRAEQPKASFSSVVRIGDTSVSKTFQPRALVLHPEILTREKRALDLLFGLPGFPMLLAADERSLHLTRVGDPASPSNLPADAEDQGRALVAALRQKGIRHNDIHPGNLQVKDGALYLIDFAWASFADEARDFLPDRIGVGRGVRAPGDPFDDQVMMDRSIAILRGKHG